MKKPATRVTRSVAWIPSIFHNALVSALRALIPTISCNLNPDPKYDIKVQACSMPEFDIQCGNWAAKIYTTGIGSK